MTKKESMTNNVLAAINEIEALIETIKPENAAGLETYELNAEHSQCIESTAENALNELKLLLARV